MKTYQKIIILLVLLVLAIFVYISKNKKTEIEKPLDNKTPTETSTSTEVAISDSTDFYDISALYPKEVRDKTSMMERDVLSIVNRKKEEWKTDGPIYKEDQNIYTQYPDRPLIKYELNIQYDKYESKDKDIISYVFKNYEFTGGAHGNTGLTTYAYDKDGLVDIKDILNLSSENKAVLLEILRDKLKISLGDLYNQEMLEAGLKNYNFQNFVVQDEGIKFIFGQYEVASYAAGFPEVLLSWNDLGTFVK